MPSTPADVIFGFYADSPFFQAALGKFRRPTRYIGLPAGPAIRASDLIEKNEPSPLLKIARSHGVEPIRMAAIGFSIGCSGVGACLASSDGPKLDAAIGIDGIHTSWTDQRQGIFNSAGLLPWQAYGARAAGGSGLCLISTSSIVPPSFVGTTVTSDYLWQAITGSGAVTAEDWGPAAVLQYRSFPPYVVPAGQSKDKTYRWGQTIYNAAPIARYRQKGSLVVYNFNNLDPSGHNDHIYQAQVILPLLLTEYLALRWNVNDPATGTCSSGTLSGLRSWVRAQPVVRRLPQPERIW